MVKELCNGERIMQRETRISYRRYSDVWESTYSDNIYSEFTFPMIPLLNGEE